MHILSDPHKAYINRYAHCRPPAAAAAADGARAGTRRARAATISTVRHDKN